jgi:hypothetical protein
MVEQAVPLRDVMRVPAGPFAVFGPQRDGQFGDHQHRETDPGHGEHGQPQDPADLNDHRADGIADRRGSAWPIVPGGPGPLRHHRDPHDHIADGDRGVVRLLERGRHTGRQHEHACHLHQREHPILQVVHVVGRREPGEVHPRPPDGEEDHQVGQDALAEPAGLDPPAQFGRRLGDRRDEGEVEQQLQRGRDPVLLVHLPGEHPSPPADHHTRLRTGHRAGNHCGWTGRPRESSPAEATAMTRGRGRKAVKPGSFNETWSPRSGSNRRPTAYKAVALATELRGHRTAPSILRGAARRLLPGHSPEARAVSPPGTSGQRLGPFSRSPDMAL